METSQMSNISAVIFSNFRKNMNSLLKTPLRFSLLSVNPQLFNAVLFHFLHDDAQPIRFDFLAAVRKIPQHEQDITGNGIDLIAFQPAADHFIEVLQTGTAVHDKLIFLNHLDSLFLVVVFVFDFPDDFLQYILHRNQA